MKSASVRPEVVAIGFWHAPACAQSSSACSWWRKSSRWSSASSRWATTWSRKLFTALARCHGLKPYRYRRQRYSTVMVRVPVRFVRETLWPELVELDRVLWDTLERGTDQVMGPVFEHETSEAEVLEDQKLVGSEGDDSEGAGL